jgi:hypothetical protein
MRALIAPAAVKCPACGQPPAYWVVTTEVAWCANKECTVLTFVAAVGRADRRQLAEDGAR